MRKFTGPVWLKAHPEALDKLHEGKTAEVNGKHYAVCDDCREVIRIDKPVVGSLHFCGGAP
jgi:hypothetical protein